MNQAVAMLREAADQGHTMAQGYCGDMYTFGWGVAKTERLAFLYDEKAAQQGERDAQCNTGIRYRDGLGCDQSYERSAEWFRRLLFRDAPKHSNRLVVRMETDKASLRVTKRPSSSTAKVLPKETLMDRTALRFATKTVRAGNGPSSCTGRVRHRGTWMRSAILRSFKFIFD